MGADADPSGGFLASTTPLLGLPLYALLTISAAALVFALLFFSLRRCSRSRANRRFAPLIPTSTKEIGEITPVRNAKGEEEAKKVVAVVKPSEGSSSSSSASSSVSMEKEKKMENIGWGRWYTLAELEAATAGFNSENVIGEGGYGIVYRGVLPDLSIVAVKNLLNNKGQAEKEFKVEVEAIGKVRHKNLVGLIGYCAEGAKRMLVYEYIDNGTLEQWLHGDVGPISPLTWDIRMKIAIGTAKGIAYLHEGLEPKVVHRDIKSSNILLNKQWYPKVSDFGLAKVLGSGSSYVTTRVMGTFGYVAPEYACTGMLNESSDVYSFGVLLMEIISGRSPVDYNRPVGEVNMVEWFKRTVQRKHDEEVLDPSIEVKPSTRALKRVLLICLRCIDMDAQKRPKMGQIIHMLEGDEFPFRIEHRSAREEALSSCMSAKVTPPANSERSMW
ncbi:probable receptor-like serine/threonine-protein kinase At4g34500 [Zingiber officinale]|uniref:probable receptor-like serine/threonine-protein kinase At4g34500 n=1 Tax=Zingiber officinale TaxID=94328 RepID=UPI001C4BC06C|nr:probable receptor-like serine/threonine-protein kinase At4g34500 [Zingiber officinale]